MLCAILIAKHQERIALHQRGFGAPMSCLLCSPLLFALTQLDTRTAVCWPDEVAVSHVGLFENVCTANRVAEHVSGAMHAWKSDVRWASNRPLKFARCLAELD